MPSCTQDFFWERVAANCFETLVISQSTWKEDNRRGQELATELRSTLWRTELFVSARTCCLDRCILSWIISMPLDKTGSGKEPAIWKRIRFRATFYMFRSKFQTLFPYFRKHIFLREKTSKRFHTFEKLTGNTTFWKSRHCVFAMQRGFVWKAGANVKNLLDFHQDKYFISTGVYFLAHIVMPDVFKWQLNKKLQLWVFANETSTPGGTGGAVFVKTASCIVGAPGLVEIIWTPPPNFVRESLCCSQQSYFFNTKNKTYEFWQHKCKNLSLLGRSLPPVFLLAKDSNQMFACSIIRFCSRGQVARRPTICSTTSSHKMDLGSAEEPTVSRREPQASLQCEEKAHCLLLPMHHFLVKKNNCLKFHSLGSRTWLWPRRAQAKFVERQG